jgi:hypothetical protein
MQKRRFRNGPLDGVTGGRQTLAVKVAIPQSDGVTEPEAGVGACSKHHRGDDHGTLWRRPTIIASGLGEMV